MPFCLAVNTKLKLKEDIYNVLHIAPDASFTS